MHLKTLLLTASALLSAAAFEPKASAPVFEPKAADFAGLGQIRTLYIGRDHDDLGCLTGAGKWTADESECGTFAAEPIGNSTFHLSVPEGGCGVDVATFKCGADVEGAIFGVGSEFLSKAPRLDKGWLTCVLEYDRPLGRMDPFRGGRCYGTPSTASWRLMRPTVRRR